MKNSKAVIGGVEYEVLLPLKFRAVKRIFPVIKQAEKLLERLDEPDFDPMELGDTTVQIVAAALERNHPECTAEFIEANVDITEMPALNVTLQEIMDGSGFSRGGGEPGEARATEGAEASPSTVTLTE